MTELTRFSRDMDGSMEPSADGAWVRFDDVAALAALQSAAPAAQQGEVVSEADITSARDHIADVHNREQLRSALSQLRQDVVAELERRGAIPDGYVTPPQAAQPGVCTYPKCSDNTAATCRGACQALRGLAAQPAALPEGEVLEDHDPLMALDECARILETRHLMTDSARCEVAAKNARAAMRVLALRPSPATDIDEAQIKLMTERGAVAWAGHGAAPAVTDEQLQADQFEHLLTIGLRDDQRPAIPAVMWLFRKWLESADLRPSPAPAVTGGAKPGFVRVGFVMYGVGQCFVDCLDAPTLTANGLAIKDASGVPLDQQLMLELPQGVDLAIGDGEAVILNRDGSTRLYVMPCAVPGYWDQKWLALVRLTADQARRLLEVLLVCRVAIGDAPAVTEGERPTWFDAWTTARYACRDAISEHRGFEIDASVESTLHSRINAAFEALHSSLRWAAGGQDAGWNDRLFSPMWLAPLDGTRVLLHLPTTNDGFAVCRWTDGHGAGWLDDEDRFIAHTPHSFMSLTNLGKRTLLGKTHETAGFSHCDQHTPQPTAADGQVPESAIAEAVKEAVAAIYFADSSDYKPALWSVVKALAPDLADLLETNGSAAYHQADDRARKAADHQPGREHQP